jgi:hypothetical protein
MFILAVAMMSLRAACCARMPVVVRLPRGVTRLVDIGAYHLAYKLDKGDVVEMPAGWSGQFNPDAGIAFTPFGVQEGKQALFMHCPWRKGTGVTFAEYRLLLPPVKPIRLRTAIAMWAGRGQPGDGVTFRISISSGRSRRTLLDEHYSENSWKEDDFDLSDLAGKEITLRLEVDPGPARDPGWDSSLWGDPRIVAGSEVPLAEQLSAIMKRRAHWPAPPDLLKLANDRTIACRPSVAHRYSNKVVRRGDYFSFEYHGDDCAIRYLLPVADPRPSNIMARVDDLAPVPLCVGEGLEFAGATSDDGLVISAALAGREVVIVRRYERAGAQAITRLTIEGKSVVIRTETDKGGAERYHLGRVGAVPFRRAVAVPYLHDVDVQYLPNRCVFISTFLDWVKTNASYHEGDSAVYQPLTDGSRNCVSQVGYVIVSPDLREVLPNIPYPPSPYLKPLAPRIVLDIWGRTYDENAALVRELRSYGVKEAAIIHHVWQRGGYDNELPTVLPANAALGGEEAMKRYSEEARRAGFLFSLHENYVDFYPNSELYTEDDVARNSDGSLIKAWFNAGTGIQSFATKPTAMLKYARMFSDEIHRRYSTTAAYLDVHPCVPPWFHVDQQARVPGAGTASIVRQEQEKLFAYERRAHGGPLFGEGNRHFYWAGIVDGVEAQVEGGEFAPLLLDFDLLKIHPQMVNHGMGYYERWLKEGYSADWWSRVPSQGRIDRYRSTEIAFGHAGFIGNPLLDKPDYVVKEYNLLSPVQARHGAAKALTIEYEIAGRMVNVSIAAALGIFDRVHLCYDSGLQVWVNRAKQDWNVRGRSIPTDGFLALAPGLVAGTLRMNGRIADVCETRNSAYADARSFIRLPGNQRKRIHPTVKSFESLGRRRFRVTYGWDVGEPLDADYHIFVHFDPAGKSGESIAFQQDHSPPLATSLWKAGSAILDGPHEIAVPASAPGKSFKFTIGLFAPGGARPPLRGHLDGTGRVMLGTINISDDGQVTFQPDTTGDDQMQSEYALYVERMNPARKVVEFGFAATNGAVRINRLGRGVEIIPVPRGAEFDVSLPMARWGLSSASTCAVRALDADGRELGRAECVSRAGRLTIRVGRDGAARYLVDTH